MKGKNKRLLFYVEFASLVLFFTYVVEIGYINVWISLLLSFGIVNLSAFLSLILNKFFEIPLRGKNAKRLVFVINIVVSIVFGIFLTIFSIRLLILKRPVLSENEVFPMVIALLSSIFLIVLAYMMLKNRYQRQVLEAEYLKRASLESKLKVLRSRLDSHFLFNLLENIAEIMRTSPESAENALLCLADLYRESLNTPMMWQLKREVNFIEKYLKLEKIRFSNKLTYEVVLPKDLEAVRIPALLIQPLVENAIVHGLKYPKGGSITIEVARDSGFVIIRILNSGRFSDEIHFGHGLSIVRDRLQSHFGEQASVRICAEGDRTVALVKFRYEEARKDER